MPMTYHSDKFFPQTTPTGWNKRNQAAMPNVRHQQQMIRRQSK